ncbi:hypothetical protein GCM10027590_22180 [Nocardiopsis nanhaiensis]
MTREALDGDDLDARSGDGHNRAAGKEDTPSQTGNPNQQQSPEHNVRVSNQPGEIHGRSG